MHLWQHLLMLVVRTYLFEVDMGHKQPSKNRIIGEHPSKVYSILVVEGVFTRVGKF